MTNGFVR